MVDSPFAICFASIWHLYGDVAPQKIMGSWHWPFGVTWRHRSRDHLTHKCRLSMGGP